MVRENQLTIDDFIDHYFCHPCNRSFSTANGARNHAQHSRRHAGEYCERCEWLFIAPGARDQHMNASRNHNVCGRCGVDFSTADALDDHDEDVHHRCRVCEQEFQNGNNLQQHLRSHQPRNIECWGCTRVFPALSAMLIHLEAGTCESGVDVADIDEWAFEDERESLNRWRDALRYRCPACGEKFRLLSALLQHVESMACEQQIDGDLEDLMEFLEHEVQMYW